MSWEVSSMQSKRSFFNVTLFKKNLSRSWPLWGGVTVLGSLVPLYLLLALMTTEYLHVDSGDFAQILYGTATAFVPAATLCYAVLIAMVVWSYLYQPRSVGMMHTLPIDRTGLFVTNALSGFAMLLIPYAVVGAFVCLLAMAWGFMDLMAVLTTVAAVLLMAVLFFGMATLCVMITGNIFALPVFYAVLNFLAPALDVLISTLAQSFLLGVGNDYTGAVEFLSPLVEIYQKFRWNGMYENGEQIVYALEGFGTVAVYGLVGVVFFALAWMLYQRRRSESAGDVVAFQWLRPVFRYGVALCSALTLGRLLYALLWETLFQSGQYADVVPMAICLAVAGLVGYYAASMLLEKSLRVFRGSLPGAVAVVAACALICTGVSMDLMGVERYVPDLEDIDTVYISSSNMVGETPTISAADHPEVVELVRDLHRAIVAQADELKKVEERNYSIEVGTEWQQEYSYHYVHLTYHMKDGSRIPRRYQLYLKREAWEQETGFEVAFKRLFTSSELQLCQIKGYPEGELEKVMVYNYDSDKDGTLLDTDRIYGALLADAQAGNLYDYDPFDEYYNESYPVSMDIEYRQREGLYEGDNLNPHEWNGRYNYVSVSLRGTMTHTIQELLDQQFITVEDLQQWDEERGQKTDYSKYEMLLPVVIGG